MRSRHTTAQGGVGTAVTTVSGPLSAHAASGLSVGRMAAVVPAGLLVWGLPALLDLGAELAERMPRSAALSLAALLVVAMAAAWVVVIRREVRA